MSATMLVLALPLRADDGAASIAAGGIVFKREPRITMAKEVLKISQKEIRVAYDFRNDTDDDVVTEIAFPVPAVSYSGGDWEFSRGRFNEFHLEVDGKAVPYQTQVVARVGNRDVSAKLRSYKIDIGSFSHADTNTGSNPDLSFLTAEQMKILLRSSILLRENNGSVIPAWTVHKRYFWRQRFAAKSSVHIEHSYVPELGGTQLSGYYLRNLPSGETAKLDAETRMYLRNIVKSICMGQDAEQRIAHSLSAYDLSWVDFILTTANTWKRPIESFTLIVNRDDPKDAVAFCWSGKVSEVNDTEFRAEAKDFIPAKNLRVGFYRRWQ